MVRRQNKVRFRADDPLRYLHVPRRKRLTEDEPGERGSDASEGGHDADFDRDAVREQTEVMPPEALA
jgi:hypothetical protein